MANIERKGYRGWFQHWGRNPHAAYEWVPGQAMPDAPTYEIRSGSHLGTFQAPDAGNALREAERAWGLRSGSLTWDNLVQ